MTCTKHKTPDARRYRRTRLKRAMQPILERFGCTQMQAAEYVESTLKQNVELRRRVCELAEENKSLRDKLKLKD